MCEANQEILKIRIWLEPSASFEKIKPAGWSLCWGAQPAGLIYVHLPILDAGT